MRMTGIDKQKTYFELLNDIIETPIYTARNWREGNKFRPGKQQPLGKILPPIDHRSIGSNEVVIELDAKSYSLNAQYATMITNYLMSQEIPCYAFWSGNKSIHIHIFLNINIQLKDNQDLIGKAIQQGCNIWRDVRLKQTREIIEQAGLSTDIIGEGKIVDLAKLNWNDIAGKTCLIRACGGSNKKIDVTGKIKEAYKTYLPTIPAKKPTPGTFEDVEYPYKLESFDVAESFVAEIAKHYLENTNERQRKTDIAFDGEHMNLPCIRAIAEGLDQGLRGFGAQQLSVALRKDGKTKEQAIEVIKKYADNCVQAPDTFEHDEATKWVNWIYNIPEPYFACGLSKKLKVCDKFSCPYYKKKYEEEMQVFDVDEPLKVVETCLDSMIIGESKLKMQLFLLMMTKYFDPEWCVLIDGPASSGKTHVMKSVAKLFGEEDEDYFIYSRLTGAVLNRIEKEAEMWKDSIVIIEEFQGTRAALEQLRVLISEKKLKLLESAEVKAPDGSKQIMSKTTTIDLKNTLFVTCQAEDEDEGDQFISRAWVLNTDESDDQTNKIVSHYVKHFDTKMSPNMELVEQIRSAIKVLARPDKVLFPFTEDLLDVFPFKSVRGRRDVKKFVSLIKASALFHQQQRRWVGNILIADWRDVKIVSDLVEESFKATIYGLGEQELRKYEIIVANITYVPEFGTDDVARWCKVSINSAQKLMSKLCRYGFFENTTRPPEKAKYKKTTFSPSFSSREPHFTQLLEKQDELIEKWIKENLDNNPENLNIK